MCHDEVTVLEHAQALQEDNDSYSFSHTAVVYEMGGGLYHGNLAERIKTEYKGSIDVASLSNVVRIPNSAFPEYDAAMFGTHFSVPPKGSYLKRPSLLGFPERAEFETAKNMSREAAVYRILRNNPEEHAAVYLGCLVRDGHVIGFFLEKYDMTLQVRMDDPVPRVERVKWLHDLRTTVAHLHTLGLCHNDINPMNVMLRDDGEVVLIDYDSCQAEGEELHKVGTMGWMRDGVTHSSPSNDEYGMRKLETFLHLAK